MSDSGSGRCKNYTKKRIVEDCWMLDLSEIPLGDPATDLPCGVLRLNKINGGELPLSLNYALVEGEDAPYLDITYPVGRKDAHENIKERIALLDTRPNRGGARRYLSCPFVSEGECCDNRVRILYLPPGERRFGCRKCHDLTYESSQTSHKYDGLCARMAGGEREGETFEILRWWFAYQLRQARKEKMKGKGGWLDAFEQHFKDVLYPSPLPATDHS
jgi:hypothetical protein